MTRYQLSLRAVNLPGGTFFPRRPPSPYAIVKVGNGSTCPAHANGSTVGKTETMVHTRDPDWVAILYLETTASYILPLTVSVYDGSRKQHVLLGEVELEATEIAHSSGSEQYRYLNSSSSGPQDADAPKIFVSMDESPPGDITGYCKLHFRGLDIRNVEPGFLGLGRSDPFFEMARKHADYSTGVVRWTTVYRSEHIDNHLNPFWDPFVMKLEELCFGKLDWPIQISVKQFQANGKHFEIGRVEATLNALCQEVAVKGNADRDKAFPLNLDRNSSTEGLLVVLQAEIVPA